MKFLRVVLSLLFVLSSIRGYSQEISKAETLGDANAIVFDLKFISGNRILANVGNKIQVWDLEKKQLITAWDISEVIHIDYFNGKVAGVSISGDLMVWDISSGAELLRKKISASTLTAVSWVGGETVVAGNDHGDILKIVVSSGEVVAKAETRNSITALAVTRNNVLVVGDNGGNIQTYSADDLAQKSSVRAHKSWIREIVMSGSTEAFITTGDDGHCKLWKSTSNMESIDDIPVRSWLLSADFTNENNRTFALGKRNGKVEVRTDFGSYEYQLKALINAVELVDQSLPYILIVVGTHGKGIRVIPASAMKYHGFH